MTTENQEPDNLGAKFEDIFLSLLILKQYNLLLLIVEDCLEEGLWKELKSSMEKLRELHFSEVTQFLRILLGIQGRQHSLDIHRIVNMIPSCDSLDSLRAHVIRILAQTDPNYNGNLNSLIYNLKKARGLNRLELIQSIAQQGNNFASGTLISILRKSKLPVLRIAAADALARIGNTEDTPYLLEAVGKESDINVVKRICHAIGLTATNDDISEIVKTIRLVPVEYRRDLGGSIKKIKERNLWFNKSNENRIIQSCMNPFIDRIQKAFQNAMTSNVSIQRLSKRRISVDDISQISVENYRKRGIPEFIKQNDVWTLKNQNTFEIQVLSKALWSFFAAMNTYPVGFSLIKDFHYQFALFSHYTSSLHSAISFLAVHGISIIPNPMGEFEVVSSKTMSSVQRKRLNGPNVMEGHITRNGWKFKSTSFSHKHRWREFDRILRKQYLNGYSINAVQDQLIKFLGSMNKAMGALEDDGKYDLLDILNIRCLSEESFSTIPEWRHEAIYGDYALDNHAFEIALNRYGGVRGMDRRVLTMQYLNEAILSWQAKNLYCITNYLRNFLGEEKFEKFVFLIASGKIWPLIIPTQDKIKLWNNIDTRIFDLFLLWRMPVIIHANRRLAMK